MSSTKHPMDPDPWNLSTGSFGGHFDFPLGGAGGDRRAGYLGVGMSALGRCRISGGEGTSLFSWNECHLSYCGYVMS